MEKKVYKNVVYYRADGTEVVASKGHIITTDKYGNGEPFFSVGTKEGRRSLDLWRKLNQKSL